MRQISRRRVILRRLLIQPIKYLNRCCCVIVIPSRKPKNLVSGHNEPGGSTKAFVFSQPDNLKAIKLPYRRYLPQRSWWAYFLMNLPIAPFSNWLTFSLDATGHIRIYQRVRS